MTGTPVRVVVADDQRVIRDGLTTILGTLDGVEVVGAASDGAEAVDMAQRQADVVLMDLRMPGTDGVTATRLLRQSQPAVAVIVLTTYVDDESILAALAAGAVGYLTKDASVEDIRRAIECAVSGQVTLDPRVAGRLVATASHQRAQPSPQTAAREDGLSPREIEVLGYAAEGLSNSEIARALYVSTSTVKSHINQIFAKTASRDRAQAVAYAHRHGFSAGPR